MYLFKLLAVLLLLLSNTTYACQINVRVPLHSTPPAFIHQDRQWRGLSIELINLWLDTANCQANFVSLPFKRGLTHLRHGKVDVMLHLNHNLERDKIYYFIGPLAYEKLTLFMRADNPHQIDSLAQLAASNEPVAIQRGLFYGADFKALTQNDKFFNQRIIKVNQLDHLIAIVERKRALGFLFSTFYGFSHKHMLDRLGNTKIKTAVLSQKPFYIALSKKSISLEQLKMLELAFSQVKDHPKFKYARDYTFPLLKKLTD